MKMRSVLTLAVAALVGTGLALAQTGAGSTDSQVKTAESGKKASKTKVYRKGSKTTSGGAQGTTQTTSPGSKVELNPQPLPPGAQVSNPKTDAASKVGFNPQPDPPVNPKTDAASKVTLNPQPLPPGKIETSSTSKNKAKSKKGSGDTTTPVPK
jgi:hypothetical protein